MELALARALVTSSRTVRSCAAKPFTVSTRFGTRSARRWYTFCTCAHFSLTLWSATTSWLLTETAQARVPPTARTTTTRAIRRPRAIAGFDYILGAPARRWDQGGRPWRPTFPSSTTPTRGSGTSRTARSASTRPRRCRRARVRVPGRARAGRDGLRVHDPPARRGVRRGLARARHGRRQVRDARAGRRGAHCLRHDHRA